MSPIFTDPLSIFIVIESGNTSFTVTFTLAVLSPTVAVIVAVPSAIALTFPCSSTVAILSSDEDQTTFTSSVVFSGFNNTPNFWDLPIPKSKSFLSIDIEFKGISVTSTSTVSVKFPTVAVIVAVPLLLAVITPFSTVATLSALEVQVTVLSSLVSSGK